MNQRDYDKFEDLIGEHRGIYGRDSGALGDALENHYAREVKPTSEGLQIRFTHDTCGQPQVAIIDWSDVIPMSFGLAPKVAYSTRIDPNAASLAERYPQWVSDLGDWAYDQKNEAWVLKNMRCRGGNCGQRDMALFLAPNEAIQAVRLARAQRWVRDEPTLVAWSQKASALLRGRQVAQR